MTTTIDGQVFTPSLAPQAVHAWTGVTLDDGRAHMWLSAADAARFDDLPPGQSRSTVTVTDLPTGTRWDVRRAPCGAGCFCAAYATPHVPDTVTDLPTGTGAATVAASHRPDTAVQLAADTVAVATIEWSSESGNEPAVYVATTPDVARALALRHVADYARACVGDDNEWDEWVTENPVPDAAEPDIDEFAVWYEGFHETTCDGWITVTTQTVHVGEQGPA